MPAKNYLTSEQQEKLQKTLKREENGDIREIAGRLFKSIEELEFLLHQLLNEGGLIIKWGRKLKNKGNAVIAV